MIICNRSEANKLISDPKNLFKDDSRNKDVMDYPIEEIKHGRGAGTKNVEPEIRKMIAEEAIRSNKTQAEIAEMYGVSPQSVEAYKNGSTSLATYNEPNEELKEVVDKTKEDIALSAKNRLAQCLQELTPSKIGAAKAKDIAGIAKDMSSVVKNMTVGDGSTIINNKILVYQPRLKEEQDYEVVEAIEG